MSDTNQQLTTPTFQMTESVIEPGYSTVVIEPLEQGYGHTLGNAIRRVLLSSLTGAAITALRIQGADHQYSTIPGVTEDVLEIALNLKQVRVKADREVQVVLEKVEETIYSFYDRLAYFLANALDCDGNVVDKLGQVEGWAQLLNDVVA